MADTNMSEREAWGWIATFFLLGMAGGTVLPRHPLVFVVIFCLAGTVKIITLKAGRRDNAQ